MMNAEQNKCLGIFGSWFGHRFKARFDTDEQLAGCAEAILAAALQKSNLGQVVGMFTGDEQLQDILGELKEKKSTYVCDVCVRCGAVRGRDQGRPAGA